MEYTFTLDQKAKGKGGDRYNCDSLDEKFTIYVPQCISRKTTKEPASILYMTISDSPSASVVSNQ